MFASGGFGKTPRILLRKNSTRSTEDPFATSFNVPWKSRCVGPEIKVGDGGRGLSRYFFGVIGDRHDCDIQHSTIQNSPVFFTDSLKLT